MSVPKADQRGSRRLSIAAEPAGRKATSYPSYALTTLCVRLDRPQVKRTVRNSLVKLREGPDKEVRAAVEESLCRVDRGRQPDHCEDP